MVWNHGSGLCQAKRLKGFCLTFSTFVAFISSNLFFTKATRDFSDGHLWYSVISRPASSTFTCVQRVSCCFSLLLCTMLTSIMFYGIPADPSEQVMDMGMFSLWLSFCVVKLRRQYLFMKFSLFPGQFEFTWQQFMIGVQSSLIMFPVNFLIVTIFRQTRPRELSCCRRKTKKVYSVEPENTQTTRSGVSLDMIISVGVLLHVLLNMLHCTHV